MTNPFESLRIPAIVGKVSESYSSTIICQKSGNFISMMVAELEPGKFAFGFDVSIDGRRRKMLPGEGQGYFLTREDAELYALGYIKARAQNMPHEFLDAINSNIAARQSLSLFD